MKTNVKNFIGFVTVRSKDNIASILALHHYKIYGTCTAILWQELNFLIRVCYLRSLADKQEMERLMDDTIIGYEWKKKGEIITDEEIVSIAGKNNLWVREVYDFCNALTLLTNLYYYKDESSLQDSGMDNQAMLHYLKSYHHFPSTMEIDFENIMLFIPEVAKKITDNIKTYLSDFEKN